MQASAPQRIAAIHDLSCLGRCALTVILPVLSVMGYQAVPLPTALLSTHTGGFENLHFHDLNEDMEHISAHFERLGITFSSVYTGFLGSSAQIQTVMKFIRRFASAPNESGRKPVVLIDPVMGDDGVLYSTYNRELVDGMRALSRHADVLTPNLTEACLLTDTPYKETAACPREEAVRFGTQLLEKLSVLTGHRIVITGIHLCDNTLLNMGLDENGSRFCITTPRCGCNYPGTGDIFASVLLGFLLATDNFELACRRAAEYCAALIRASVSVPSAVRYGVALEPHLSELAMLLAEENKKKEGKVL